MVKICINRYSEIWVGMRKLKIEAFMETTFIFHKKYASKSKKEDDKVKYKKRTFLNW